MNPAKIALDRNIVTWVVIVGSYLADTTLAEGVMASIGIGVGSFGWFTLVAWLARKA